jgi:hypothetical protein
VKFRDSEAKAFVLDDFFEQWGVALTSNGIGQFANGPTGILSMTVNGVPNPQLGQYAVKNGDSIVINFA